MQRRDCTRTRQADAEAPTPYKEQVDESVNVLESSAHPQTSQSVRLEPAPGPIPGQMEQMAQMLARPFSSRASLGYRFCAPVN